MKATVRFSQSFVSAWSFLVISFSVLASAIAQEKPVREKPPVTADQLILPAEIVQIGDHQAFVFLPDVDKRRQPQPWIMYAPTLLPQYPDRHEKWMHEQFLAAGVAVAGIDVGEAYGSPRGCDAMDQLYEELVSKRGFAPQVCLFGRSRGGLWASSWAIRNPSRVNGLVGIYPVYDLTTYPGVAKAAKAYDMTAEQLGEQLDRFNPIRQIDRLAAAKIPVAIIHGAIDEVVPLDKNSAQLKSTYRAAGCDDLVQLIVIDDQGHNFWPGFFQSQPLVDFAIERAMSGP